MQFAIISLWFHIILSISVDIGTMRLDKRSYVVNKYLRLHIVSTRFNNKLLNAVGEIFPIRIPQKEPQTVEVRAHSHRDSIFLSKCLASKIVI